MGFQPSQEYIDRLANDTSPLEARFHGYIESEWKRFTKGQRRIVTLIMDLKRQGLNDHDMKIRVRQIMEISPSCLRSHLSNVRKMAKIIKRERVLAGTPTDDIKPPENFKR